MALNWFSIARLWLIVCLVSSFYSSHAQTFSELYPDPIKAGGHIGWADYDQDGDPDLITSGVFKNGVAATILYRNDQGNFVDVGEDFEGFTGKVQMIDWEDDGDLDLFLCDSEIKIFKNENGIFTYHPTTGYYRSMLWKDYDNDQDLDLLGLRENGIVIMENKEGIFESRYLIPTIQDVIQFDIADYNSDGQTDLLIKKGPYHDVSIKVYLNEDEYFSPDNTNSFVSIPSGLLESFDYDDDGDIDILLKGTITEGDTRSGYLYKNDGGLFTLTSNAFFDTGHAMLYNLDTDDDLEVIRANAQGDSLLYFDNSANGEFTRIKNSVFYEFNSILSISYASTAGEPPYSYLCVSGEIYNGNFATRIYHKNQGMFENIYHSPFDQMKGSETLAWMDFNDDGLKDVYVEGSSFSSYPLSKLYKNTGSSFESAYKFEYQPVVKGEWMDFNKDGKLDFLTLADRDVLLYEGFKEAQVTRKKVATIRDSDAFPKAIDFDNDSDYDLMINGYMEGLYTNNNNVFAQSIPFADGYRYLGLSAWADYDLDGDQDFVMHLDAENIGGRKAHLYNNTNGSFKDVVAITFPNLSNAHFFWLDFNLDAYPDLFLFGSYGNANVIRLYKNVEGVFTLADASVFSNSQDLKWPIRIQVVDFNIDGYPDIVIGGDIPTISGSKLSFYQNINGAFQTYSSHGIPTMRYQNFVWADYDNDGDPDMLHTGMWDNPKTQIYLNNIVDNKGPVVHSLTPRNKQVLRSEGAYQLKIEFHEPILKSSGMLRIYSQSDDQLIYQVNVLESSILINGNVATINVEGTVLNNNDKIYVLLDNGTFRDKNNNPSKGVLDKSSWTLTVNAEAKMNQTISFSTLPPVYVTDASFELTATASSNLPVSFTSSNPSVASINGRVVTILSAGNVLITASQDGNSVYNKAPSVEQLLVVSKLDQHITFEPLTNKLLTDGPFELVANASSGLTVNYTSSNSMVATISNNIVTILGAGTTVITAEQTGNDSYAAAIPAQQTLTVNKLTQHIIFEPLPVKSIADDPFELLAIASSGLPIVYSLSNSDVVTLTGNTLTVIGAGEVQITASQQGDDRFEAALPVLQVLVVNMITGLEKSDAAEMFSVFPNPTTDKMTLRLNDVSAQNLIQIDFLDGYGRVVKQVHSKGKTESILTLDDLNTGVYTLQIFYSGAVFWKRVVLIR